MCCAGLYCPPLPGEWRCIPPLPGIVRDVDSRRNVPRTDLLLADPRLAEAERRLGRALVKAAVGRAQQRARDGRDRPGARSPTPPWPRCRARATALRPVINATGVLRAHQPRPGAAVRRRASTRSWPRPGTPTSSSTWPPGGRARRGAGALAALAAGRPGRGGRRTWSTTTPPPWSSPPPRWPPEPRDRHQPRRAGRDRRRLPPARPARVHRRPAARGRHHQPDRRWRTTPRPSARDTALRPQGAPVQLPRRGLHRRRRPSPSWPALGRAGGRRHRLRAARARTRCCPTSRTRPPRCGPAPPWSPPAATSCSAARRPGCCSAEAELVERAAPAPAGPGAAGRQAHPRRARGHPRRPAYRRSRPRWHADPAALRRAGRAARGASGRRRRRRRVAAARPRSAAAARPAWSCPAPRSSLPEALRRAAARRRARRRRPRRARAAACSTCARSPDAAGRRRLRRGVMLAQSAMHRSHVGRLVHVDRHRRARRPRQVDAGAGADRDGARPVGRGAAPRA